ncbi:YqjK family protein [Serratia nevei]|uniref:YqjK family protein n=1 Tax=Serratia nevei TaxID=2703794 RepID=UPI003FA707BA
MSRPPSHSNKKKVLINTINNQRLALALCKEDFLKGTIILDRGWQTFYRMRLFLGLGLGAILLKAARKKPSRFIAWPRRLVSVWSASGLIKNLLNQYSTVSKK